MLFFALMCFSRTDHLILGSILKQYSTSLGDGYIGTNDKFPRCVAFSITIPDHEHSSQQIQSLSETKLSDFSPPQYFLLSLAVTVCAGLYSVWSTRHVEGLVRWSVHCATSSGTVPGAGFEVGILRLAPQNTESALHVTVVPYSSTHPQTALNVLFTVHDLRSSGGRLSLLFCLFSTAVTNLSI
jgi:hypothetical protein